MNLSYGVQNSKARTCTGGKKAVSFLETGSGSVRGINSMTGLFDRAIMCESIAARRGYETRRETWRTEK